MNREELKESRQKESATFSTCLSINELHMRLELERKKVTESMKVVSVIGRTDSGTYHALPIATVGRTFSGVEVLVELPEYLLNPTIERNSEMATAAHTPHLVSVSTQTDLVLIKQGGHYQRGDEILVGDMYGYADTKTPTILVVSKVIKVESLAAAIPKGAKIEKGA